MELPSAMDAHMACLFEYRQPQVIDRTQSRTFRLGPDNHLTRPRLLRNSSTSPEQPTARGFIIPSSHLAWAVSYFDARSIVLDPQELPDGETAFLDFDGGSILVPEDGSHLKHNHTRTSFAS